MRTRSYVNIGRMAVPLYNATCIILFTGTRVRYFLDSTGTDTVTSLILMMAQDFRYKSHWLPPPIPHALPIETFEIRQDLDYCE